MALKSEAEGSLPEWVGRQPNGHPVCLTFLWCHNLRSGVAVKHCGSLGFSVCHNVYTFGATAGMPWVSLGGSVHDSSTGYPSATPGISFQLCGWERTLVQEAQVWCWSKDTCPGFWFAAAKTQVSSSDNQGRCHHVLELFHKIFGSFWVLYIQKVFLFKVHHQQVNHVGNFQHVQIFSPLTSLRSFHYWKQLCHLQTLISWLPASSCRSSMPEIPPVPGTIPGFIPWFIYFLSQGPGSYCLTISKHLPRVSCPVVTYTMGICTVDIWSAYQKIMKDLLNTNVNCIFQINFSATCLQAVLFQSLTNCCFSPHQPVI